MCEIAMRRHYASGNTVDPVGQGVPCQLVWLIPKNGAPIFRAFARRTKTASEINRIKTHSCDQQARKDYRATESSDGGAKNAVPPYLARIIESPS